MQQLQTKKDQVLSNLMEDLKNNSLVYTYKTEVARRYDMDNKTVTFFSWVQGWHNSGNIKFDPINRVISLPIQEVIPPTPIKEPIIVRQPTVINFPQVTDWHTFVAKIFVMVGAGLLVASQIAIDFAVPYLQGTSFTAIKYLNEMVPGVRNLGVIIVLLGLPSLAKLSWKHALVCWVLYVSGIYWSTINNYEWTISTTNDAVLKQSDSRRIQLEQQFDIPNKRKRAAEASSNASNAMKQRNIDCSRNDGSLCIADTRHLVPEAINRESSASNDLRMAEEEVRKALAKSDEQRTPNINLQSKAINTVIPLLGGLLFRIVSL